MAAAGAPAAGVLRMRVHIRGKHGEESQPKVAAGAENIPQPTRRRRLPLWHLLHHPEHLQTCLSCLTWSSCAPALPVLPASPASSTCPAAPAPPALPVSSAPLQTCSIYTTCSPCRAPHSHSTFIQGQRQGDSRSRDLDFELKINTKEAKLTKRPREREISLCQASPLPLPSAPFPSLLEKGQKSQVKGHEKWRCLSAQPTWRERVLSPLHLALGWDLSRGRTSQQREDAGPDAEHHLQLERAVCEPRGGS